MSIVLTVEKKYLEEHPHAHIAKVTKILVSAHIIFQYFLKVRIRFSIAIILHFLINVKYLFGKRKIKKYNIEIVLIARRMSMLITDLIDFKKMINFCFLQLYYKF